MTPREGTPREGAPAEEALREEVRHALRTAEVRAALDRYAGELVAGGDPDPRPVHRLLGARRLLAVHWPTCYGGRGGTSLEHAAVVEELVLAGVPDTLHTLSVQIVGSFLLTAGTPAQRAALLPPIADGSLTAAVLYSEPDAGSDLAALSTRAEPAADGGWVLRGRKTWSVRTWHAGVGLCLARTGDGSSPYQGLTLFLVPLDRPGVGVGEVAALADEAYADVVLDGVVLGADAVVGPVGGAWPLVTAALALERTGVDTAAKAARWLAAALGALGAGGIEPDLLPAAGRLATDVAAARLMARRAAAAGAALAPTVGAATKVHCAGTAARVARWGLEALGPAGVLGRDDPGAPAGGVLEAAAREAPGLTVSAGTTEVLLDLVAAGLPADGGLDAPADPVAARLAHAVRAVLATARPVDTGPDRAGRAGLGPDGPGPDRGGPGGATDPDWPALARLGVFRLAVPLADGGLDLGLAAAAEVCLELGRAGVDGGLLDTLSVAALLPPGEERERALAGRLRAAVVDAAGRGFLATRAELLVVPGPVDRRCVRVDAPGVRVGPGTAGWDGVEVEPATLAAGAVVGPADAVGDRVRRAAWLVGLAAGGLGRTVRRVRERRQFGRAVADNQAVAHRLARAAIDLDAARLLVADAAARADAGCDAAAAAAGALAAAAELAPDVLRAGVQLHGAHGTTATAPIARLAALGPLAAARGGRPDALRREVAVSMSVSMAGAGR